MRPADLLLLLLPLTLGGAALPGCSGCDTQGAAPLEYLDGTVSTDGRLYESTPVDGDMLHFPPGRIYDLVHGLGVRPASVHGYVSLAPRLESEGDPYDAQRPNNVTESAGNQLVIERWDEQVIRVRNDTCAEWYVRVVAIADPSSLAVGGAGGASR
jgi:hypothetical protein